MVGSRLSSLGTGESSGGRRTDTKVFSKEDIKAAAAVDKETKIVRGRMIEVACSKGLTIYLRIGTPNIDERVENLHADIPNVEWLSDTGETLDAMKCEKVPGQPEVAITYKPKRKGLMMGEPLIVEFCRGVSFSCDVVHPPRQGP